MATENKNFRVKNSITIASSAAGEYTLPTADGSANQVITTDGNGNLSFSNANVGITEVSDDTTPQLGGNLDVNGNTITSASNGDITLDPDGTGAVVFTSNIVFEGATADAFETTFAITDPTQDRTITFKNESGTVAYTADISLGTLGIDATADEIDTLDGILASTSELNIMNGVTATTAEINYLDGFTGFTLDNAGDLLIVGTDGTSIDSSDLLNIDTANGRLGIGTSTPARTLHLVGDTQFEGSMRIDQYHNSADGPDVLLQKARGTPSVPVANQTGDELGKFVFYTHDGTDFRIRANIVSDSQVQGANYGADLDFQTSANGTPASRLYIAPAGDITFNNAFTFPTADGTANQVLGTDGSGNVDFVTVSYNNLSDTPTIPVVPTNISEFTNDSGYVVRDEVEEYSFRIGADDSTARLVDNGEQINIYGGTNISSTIDAEGNITIDNELVLPTKLSDLTNDVGFIPTAEEFDFKVGADDSTARTVDHGEQINFLGTTGISTTSSAEGNITIAGNIDGLGGVTLGSQNETLIVGAGNNTIATTDLLAFDTTNNRVGIGTTSPATKFHIAGEGTNEGQIRLQQANDGSDGPDFAFYASRGTIASPAAVQSGDTHGRINAYAHNGTNYLQSGSFGWSGTDTSSNNTFDIRSRVGGTLAKRMEVTSDGDIEFQDGAFDVDILSHDGTNGLKLAGTLVTTTAAELNVIDGDTAATSTTIADADRVVVNDNGTMKQVAVTDLNTYFQSSVAGGSDTQVQYNNSGALAGSANFTWDNDGGDDSNGLLTVQNATVTNRLSLGGAGSQFFAFNEDTVRVKFANWYQADDHQYGMGMLWYETWIGALDQNAGAANRRIGFYLEQPNRGASNALYGTSAHPSNGRGWFEIDHFGLSHLNPIRFYNDDQTQYTELRGGNSGTNRTITLPDASGTVALRDDPVVTIAADDSTARTVSFGEQFGILGTTGISTTSNAEGDITIAGNIDGLGGVTLGSQNEILIVGAGDNTVTSTSTLTIDDGNNYIGINQTSPDVTLHMTGEGAQTAQIRMEQYNDSQDAPDLRTRRYRGTVAAPADVNAGDYLYRMNVEARQGGSIVGYHSLQFDVDDTDADAGVVQLETRDTAGTSAVRLGVDSSGAVYFGAEAYTMPTADGNANEVLRTDGSGNISFGEPNLDIVNALTAAATVTLDPTDGGIQTITLGQDTTFTLSNWSSGHRMTLMIDDGANRSVTWPTMQWAGGVEPTLGTTGFNTIELWYVGTTLYGAYVGNMS